MKTLDVNTGIPYKIYIEHGILNDAGKYIREVSGALRAVIISDSNVAPLYASVVESSLKKEGFETSVFVFEAGEERKRLSTIERMYMHFFDHNITRTDIVVALGGGGCKLSPGDRFCADTHKPSFPGGFLCGRENRRRSARR